MLFMSVCFKETIYGHKDKYRQINRVKKDRDDNIHKEDNGYM